MQGTQRPPRAVQARKFGISALQAAWFNVWLSRRMATLPLHGILPGDVLRREDSGGLFVCCEPAVDAARATAWELSPTGPIWGPKMPMPTGEALAFEQTVMTEVGAQALIPRLGRWGRGTRRAARVPLKEARLVWREKALELRFVLPPGAYATQVLHQLFHGGAQEAVDGLAASAHPA
ncbi:MAG: tRNA pseudouridine(13) synthase TruD [Polyangiales bacterium]